MCVCVREREEWCVRERVDAHTVFCSPFILHIVLPMKGVCVCMCVCVYVCVCVCVIERGRESEREREREREKERERE